MEEILGYIQANIAIAPFLIFGLLLLAGLNLPVSEDVMLFTSALLAAKNPEYKYQLFAGVFAGAYFSDLIAYSLGRFLGPQLFKIKWFSKMATPEKLDKVSGFYEKYGIVTLILGRFIPFGVRNALFISAGLSKMNFVKFSLSDLVACTISSVVFFSLYFTLGETVVEYVKRANIIIFGIAVLVAMGFWIKNKKKAA